MYPTKKLFGELCSFGICYLSVSLTISRWLAAVSSISMIRDFDAKSCPKHSQAIEGAWIRCQIWNWHAWKRPSSTFCLTLVLSAHFQLGATAMFSLLVSGFNVSGRSDFQIFPKLPKGAAVKILLCGIPGKTFWYLASTKDFARKLYDNDMTDSSVLFSRIWFRSHLIILG